MGYSSHGRWSTIGQIRELEEERGNPFPSKERVKRNGFTEDTPAIWLTYRKEDALRYLLPASEWDRITKGKLTSEEKEMLDTEIFEIEEYRTDKVLTEDTDGGYLLVRPTEFKGYKYSIEVAKDNEGYSYYFHKFFGDSNSSGGPADSKEEVMKEWRQKLEEWKKYDSILERMSDPVTEANTNFRTNTPEFSKGEFFGTMALTGFPKMTKREESKMRKVERLPEHKGEKNVIYTEDEVIKRIEQGLPFITWWGGSQRHVVLKRHKPTGKIIALGFKQQHFPEPYQEVIPPPLPNDRWMLASDDVQYGDKPWHKKTTTKEEQEAYIHYWEDWERIDPWYKKGEQPGLRHKRGFTKETDLGPSTTQEEEEAKAWKNESQRVQLDSHCLTCGKTRNKGYCESCQYAIPGWKEEKKLRIDVKKKWERVDTWETKKGMKKEPGGLDKWLAFGVLGAALMVTGTIYSYVVSKNG